MRIAFVHQPWDDADPARREGSLAVWTWEVARRLAQQHDVHVFGRRPAGGPAEQVAEGITFHGVRVEHDRPLLRLLDLVPETGRSRRPRFAHPLYHAVYAWKIARAVRRLGCDIIHVQNFSNFVPVLRRYNPRARIVLHMHCEWLSQLDPTLIAPRLALTDAIIGCSDYVVTRIRRRFPRVAERCHTLPNGVDPERFAAAAPGERNGHRRVLFVGRVSPEKGVHTLLGAFERVAASRPDCSLDIVGPLAPAPRAFIAALSEPEVTAALQPCYAGDYIAALRSQAARCGRAALAGAQPHETLPEVYRRADVLVNPSFSEAFGMSLVEAMAAGRPVVATRVGGMTEIVEDGVTGLLVPPGDEAALAQAILRLVDDPERAGAMGARGREVVRRRYAWDRVAQRLAEIYQGTPPRG